MTTQTEKAEYQKEQLLNLFKSLPDVNRCMVCIDVVCRYIQGKSEQLKPPVSAHHV